MQMVILPGYLLTVTSGCGFICIYYTYYNTIWWSTWGYTGSWYSVTADWSTSNRKGMSLMTITEPGDPTRSIYVIGGNEAWVISMFLSPIPFSSSI
jgi:hypothetical protein